MEIDEWKGCYPSNWKGVIVPEAISHPAKFSSRLIRKIYEHMAGEGWLHGGDTVIDPFGGVALGAFDAMRLGLNWRGCELESRFVELGNANIALWKKRYSWWTGSGLLVQGDSRNLAKVLQGAAEATISSPPYADSLEKANGIDADKLKSAHRPNSQAVRDPRYSAAAISSPPYADGCAHTGGDNESGKLDGGEIRLPGLAGVVSSPPYSEARIGQESGQEQCGHGDQYGATPGQLGAMKANGFEAAVSSPPYENAINQNGEGPGMAGNAARRSRIEAGAPSEIAAQSARIGYGRSNGNIGNDNPDDFWLAARQIVEQVYQVLIPGGHACWVVKGFVKNKTLVDFPGQWRELCESVGFVTLHEHHALLVRDNGTSHLLEGGEIHHQTESKSFFRRLAEKKGSPRIDYETVFCMIK